jgi:hypothetical protein
MRHAIMYAYQQNLADRCRTDWTGITMTPSRQTSATRLFAAIRPAIWQSMASPLIGTMLAAILIFGPSAARADTQSPRQYCRTVGNDDTPREIPESLVRTVQRLFKMDSPDEAKLAVTARCMNGQVLVCNEGANLPCAKANTARVSQGASAFCRSHPNEPVPAVAVGHDSIYAWRCRGNQAEPAETVWHVDARGFVTEVWKPLP